LAKNKAEELTKRVKAGEKFDAAARSLGLEPKTSDPIARDGSIPGAASGKQVSAAFNLKTGEWQILEPGTELASLPRGRETEPNPADFDKQKKQLTEELLHPRETWRLRHSVVLGHRLKQEGKLKLMPEKLKSFGTFG